MRSRVLAITAVLAMALTACSGGDSGDSGNDGADAPAADGAVTFTTGDTLEFGESSKAATVGEDGSLEVTIECTGSVEHNVVFEGVNGDAIIAECTGGESDTGTVQVEAGSYTYYCSIPGHREAGMEGQITVS